MLDNQGRDLDKYEACDDADCRALREPETLEELKEALDHWRYCSRDSGCSHGC